jgi:hypothetical protein
MGQTLINWESYYNFYQLKSKDLNTFEFYYDNEKSTIIAAAMLELFLHEIVSIIDFTQFSLSNFLTNLPINGAYDTNIFWEIRNSNTLIARIKKNINVTTDPKYQIAKLVFSLPYISLDYGDKAIIPFENNTYHETNNNCSLCWQIDKIYEEILTSQLPEDIMQSKLKHLDQLLVNGYKLLTVYEKNGYASASASYKEKIAEVKKYRSLHGDDFETDDVRLIHSRWCKNCGSRKPDIYERGREIDE